MNCPDAKSDFSVSSQIISLLGEPFLSVATTSSFKSDHRESVSLPASYVGTIVSILLIASILTLVSGVNFVRADYALTPILEDVTAAPSNPFTVDLSAKITANGHDTYWVFQLQGLANGGSYQTWIPPGCSGEVGDDAQQIVSCTVSGLTPSSSYNAILSACWGPIDLTYMQCEQPYPSSFAEENTQWTQLAATSTTTSSSCATCSVYTLYTGYTNVISAFLTSTSTTSLLSSQPPTNAVFDFMLSLTPSAASIGQGGTADFTVGVVYSDPSYAGTMITVQVIGLGPEMDYSLSQNGALIITTSPTTPTGTYPFTIIGAASGVTHQITGTIIITQSGSVSTAPVTITTPTSTSPSLVSTVTSVVTQTVQPTPTSTETSTSNTQPSSDVIGMLQQNSLPVIGILIIVVVGLAALKFKKPKSTGPAPLIQLQTGKVIYCSHCGAPNSTTDNFCKKCGTRFS